MRFLGLINYYRNFCEGYGLTVKCLYNLLKKEFPEKIESYWTEEHTKAFDKVRGQIVNATQLAHPTYDTEMIVTCDSSGEGVGYSLSQIKDIELPSKKIKRLEVPIAFGSRAFNETERKAGSSERELLGLYYAIRKFYYYLRFTKVIIRIDCQALTSLKLGFSGKYLRQHRLIEFLDSVLDKENTTVIYKKGSSNYMKPVDSLSRHSAETWENIRKRILPTEAEEISPLCNVVSEEPTLKKGENTDLSTILSISGKMTANEKRKEW